MLSTVPQTFKIRIEIQNGEKGQYRRSMMTFSLINISFGFTKLQNGGQDLR